MLARDCGAAARLAFLHRGVDRVQRSRITRRALAAPPETGRPVEGVGGRLRVSAIPITAAEPDRAEALLAIFVGNLARTWTKREPTIRRSRSQAR